MVVGEGKLAANSIMEGIENTGDVRLHDHRLRLKQRFDIVRKLGQGTYGKVQLGINKRTGQEVAIKTIKKCKIETEADLVRIRREVQIMSSVRHPNIVHIYEVFENSEKMILVMEYCSGGELYDYLSQQKVLPEDEARRLFRQVATAVYYCHKHKICHRDLKLENVLLDDSGSAKIADFGLSNVFEERRLLATFCGSPLYASPEIVKGTPYIGPEVDCWSLGVLLYTLVYGAMPFDGSNFARLVKQISNGDYFEPKIPSTASPLIRDMLTVDAIQRADIPHICDHPWVNEGSEISCLELAEALANETPVRLDLLLSLAPPPQQGTDNLLVDSAPVTGAPGENTPCHSMSVSSMLDGNSSAERRILEMVAEGGTDAIKPSPTRTLVTADTPKRKLQTTASTESNSPHNKKERAESSKSIDQASSEDLAMTTEIEAQQPPAQPEVIDTECVRNSPDSHADNNTLQKSATMTVETKSPNNEVKEESPKKEKPETPTKPKELVKKKISPTKTVAKKERSPEKSKSVPKDSPPYRKSEEQSTVSGEAKARVAEAAGKLNALSIATPAPTTPTHLAYPAPLPMAANTTKTAVPGVSVGSFKEQFERRASLTSPQVDVKKTTPAKVSVAAKVKAKAQSEEREREPTESAVRLQHIGIEPSKPIDPLPVKKPNPKVLHKSESCKESTTTKDNITNSLSLQDARKNLQNSMALLTQARSESSSTASSGATGSSGGPDDRQKRVARDIIASAIDDAPGKRVPRICTGGKPPVPYGASGRSSSATVNLASLCTPTTPTTPPTPSAAPRTFRTEALHRVQDVRPGVNSRSSSVERIIPIQFSSDGGRVAAPSPVTASTPTVVHQRTNSVPFRLTSLNRGNTVEPEVTAVATGSSRDPIKKSPREFIIPIAVEGGGYVTPRQGSLEPDSKKSSTASFGSKFGKHRRISLVSGEESEDEDDLHMHRLRSTRRQRADVERESVSSGEEDDDEGFELLTADNLFSTLLDRVRTLTQRLNGEEGPGFSPHHHSLFNNLNSPFFNRDRERREGPSWRHGAGMSKELDSMFARPSRTQGGAGAAFPRGGKSSKKSHKQKNALQQTENADMSKHQNKLPDSLDLSDLDLSCIQLSEKEMQTLSGLTPALSRRLQHQLLAQLPAAAARSLRRTLSMHVPPPPLRDTHIYTRSLSAKPDHKREQSVASDRTDHSDISALNVDQTDASISDRQSPEDSERANTVTPTANSRSPPCATDCKMPTFALDTRSIPHYSTLPRLKRHSSITSDTPSLDSAKDDTLLSDYSVTKSASLSKSDPNARIRGGSLKTTPDRSVFGKYLTPEKSTTFDESLKDYDSDATSLIRDPCYLAAYGAPSVSNIPMTGSLRRHSLRTANDTLPRRRISRFLRPDFYDTPRDESVYVREKKDREMETQKVLKEIREKRNRSSDRGSLRPRSPLSPYEGYKIFSEEINHSPTGTSTSPISGLLYKERSRSSTPFLPILDNIHESKSDSLRKTTTSPLFDTKSINNNDSKHCDEDNGNHSNILNTRNGELSPEVILVVPVEKKVSPPKESKISRPKSFPNKPSEATVTNNYSCSTSKELSDSNNPTKNQDDSYEPNCVGWESKLIRPKSYPASSPSPEKVFLQPKQLSNEINVQQHQSETLHVEATGESNKSTDANGNITVTFNVNLPTKTKKTDQATEQEGSEPKKTVKIVKKKVVKKKVSQKSVECSNETEANETFKIKTVNPEKKKLVKVKNSATDSETPKKVSSTKKKSVLQSLGQKFDKLRGETSSKANTPEKDKPERTEIQHQISEGQKADCEVISTLEGNLEPSCMLPEPTTESGLIKRAVTNTKLAVDTSAPNNCNKKSVSRVLGLFRKFESKDRNSRSLSKTPPKSINSTNEENSKVLSQSVDEVHQNMSSNSEYITAEPVETSKTEKPKRPTSLLLNGFGKKAQPRAYCGAVSDSVLAKSQQNIKEKILNKNVNSDDSKKDIPKRSLKLDFSRLPRLNQNIFQKRNSTDATQSRESSVCKELVHSDNNQTVSTPSAEETKATTDTKKLEESNIIEDKDITIELSNQSPSEKYLAIREPLILKTHSVDRTPLSENATHSSNNESLRRKELLISPLPDVSTQHPLRLSEPTTPEREDVIERIRRKSFYSRFNEKKPKRKSSLVGPGAKEYNPALRIHGPELFEINQNNYEISPSSPTKSYDLPCVGSTMAPLGRHLNKLDNYRSSDVDETYRSLDRRDSRKSSINQKYSPGIEGPSTYLSPRYARTRSLFDENENHKLNHRPLDNKYNRTLSMYSPGSYATYSPRSRTQNAAILLKDDDSEKNTESILKKLSERKKASLELGVEPFAASAPCRSDNTPKSESNGTECTEETN